MIGDKKVLAVILARAGSKGIPGKNYRDLLGKPLFMWSVEAALQSKYIDRIVVSSNCWECSCKFADYIMPYRDNPEYVKNLFFQDRPEEYSTDTSKNEDALIHVLKTTSSDYDVVVNLQVTSPCRLDGLVDLCIEEYDEGGYDSLLTGTKDTPFLWRKIYGKWEYPVDFHNCCNRKMRQEFDECEFMYHDNGNLYITESRILLDKECRIGEKPCVFETKGLNSLQIDEEFDFELIEQMVKVKGLTTLI